MKKKEKFEVLNQNILNKLEQIKILGGYNYNEKSTLDFTNCKVVCNPHSTQMCTM